jgi:nucleoside-diphosphate-sugar epimerase
MDSIGRNAGFGNGLRAVATGGTGFFGSHLGTRLLQRGCSVVAIDKLSTGNMRNITSLFGRGDFHFVQHARLRCGRRCFAAAAGRVSLADHGHAFDLVRERPDGFVKTVALP